MSGHSKWHNIKRAKEASDKQKGKVFGQITRDIMSAVNQGGSNPESNSVLRDALARARKSNIPQANIDRLLHEKNDLPLQLVMYEGFGPGGAALIIEAHTDNTNRTVSELRSIVKKYGCMMSGPNSVRWKFKENMVPIYRHPLSPVDRATLQLLIQELTGHADVRRVATDAQ